MQLRIDSNAGHHRQCWPFLW